MGPCAENGGGAGLPTVFTANAAEKRDEKTCFQKGLAGAGGGKIKREDAYF